MCLKGKTLRGEIKFDFKSRKLWYEVCPSKCFSFSKIYYNEQYIWNKVDLDACLTHYTHKQQMHKRPKI